MESGIRQSIEDFVRAGDEQRPELLMDATHPDFRVVAPNYPTEGVVSVLSREQFGGLLASKKIGGEERKIEFVNCEMIGESGALVRAQLTSASLVFQNAFSLVKKGDGQWKLVQDMASAKPR